jgi:hypothetical protein
MYFVTRVIRGGVAGRIKTANKWLQVNNEKNIHIVQPPSPSSFLPNEKEAS